MTLLTLNSNSIHLWCCEVVPGFVPEQSVLCQAEWEKADSFHFQRDRLVYLKTREMQRRLLSRYAAVKPADWVFRVAEFGRPQIASPDLDNFLAHPLYFNLSHTHQHIVFIISQFAIAGVDIESRLPENIAGIATEFFTTAEQSWLLNADNQTESRYRFLTLWTLKEAWIKALGTGLSTPLDSFSVVPDEKGQVRLNLEYENLEHESHPEEWWFYRSQLDENTLLAVAAKTNISDQEILFSPEMCQFCYY